MQHIHHDLGNVKQGQLVLVTLKGSSANVRLMDAANFNSYKNGRRHRFWGGHARKSPVRLVVPRTGHWHVAVDLGGYGGTIRSGVQVLPGALSPIEESSLASVPSLLDGGGTSLGQATGTETHDVFISHASEDKETVVRPLANALREAGLRVWFDEFELRMGDSLRRTIDKGLANSRFGVVVLSQAFFSKEWPNYELDGIVTQAATGEQVMLPIWHNVSKDEVIRFSPSLADKVARSTSTHTISEIANEIAELIHDDLHEPAA